MISSYKNNHTIFGCIEDNIKQSAKQIINTENDSDEMRQTDQVHDMDAYTRPTLYKPFCSRIRSSATWSKCVEFCKHY